jgi:hypothetical protein
MDSFPRPQYKKLGNFHCLRKFRNTVVSQSLKITELEKEIQDLKEQHSRELQKVVVENAVEIGRLRALLDEKEKKPILHIARPSVHTISWCE